MQPEFPHVHAIRRQELSIHRHQEMNCLMSFAMHYSHHKLPYDFVPFDGPCDRRPEDDLIENQ